MRPPFATFARSVPPMTLLHILLLAMLQGLTEFLPISSSAHLILVPSLTHMADQSLAFDVSVHVGTLVAVLWYFRQEVGRLLGDWAVSCVRRETVGESRLAWILIVASVPVGVAGLLLHDLVETVLRSPLVIAATTIGFGLLLWWSDAAGPRKRDEHTIGWGDGLLIGIAQALALVPGTSRSGITMTAGLFLGLTRQAAARFSFLLSIPAILMAGGYQTLKLLQAGDGVDWASLGLGALFSAITAYLCIGLFLKWLDRTGMLPFVIYRLLLGGVLLYLYL